MTIHRTTTHIAAVLGGVSKGKGSSAERLLRLVPSLSEGTLVSARVGFRARLHYLAVELWLETQPRVARVQRRLAFWFAREGGWATTVGSMGPRDAERFRESFARCDVSLCDLAVDGWESSIRRVFAAAGTPPHADLPSFPELRVQVGGPGWDGFTFDAAQRLLLVPSPLAPPTGDDLILSLDPVERATEPCRARATVVDVTRPADASPGSPAGFTLALDRDGHDACALLEERCPAERGGLRVAPRYRVVCGARLTGPGEESLRYGSEDDFLRDYVRNLSHGGAFVQTSEPRKVGERIDLHLGMPGGRDLRIPATVVHRTDAGVGVEFVHPCDADTTLSAAVAGLAGRSRRVLVVDDDALVRRILADAFEARGFEVITATNGEAGLRAITDELFSLDAVVTDLRMPGLSGGALVRGAHRGRRGGARPGGGERDDGRGARRRPRGRRRGPRPAEGGGRRLRGRRGGGGARAPDPGSSDLSPEQTSRASAGRADSPGVAMCVGVLLALAVGRSRLAVEPLRLTPEIVEVRPERPWSDLSVRNAGSAPREVHVDVLAWSQDDAGRVVLAPADDASVFPSRAVLAPGEQRVFRLSSFGPAPEQERAYRIFGRGPQSRVRRGGEGARPRVRGAGAAHRRGHGARGVRAGARLPRGGGEPRERPLQAGADLARAGRSRRRRAAAGAVVGARGRHPRLRGFAPRCDELDGRTSSPA